MARAAKKRKPKAPSNAWPALFQGAPLAALLALAALAYRRGYFAPAAAPLPAGAAGAAAAPRDRSPKPSTSASPAASAAAAAHRSPQPAAATALAALLDAALRTPLARRQPVPLAAADALLAAWEASEGSRSVGVNAVLTLGTSETSEGTGLATTTGGGLAPLG